MDIDLSQALVTQLLSELSDYGISCNTRQASLLIHHLLLVIEKNKVVNLTRITDPENAVTLHVVDSLLPLASRMSLLAPESRYVDIGTGAGFPGIPLGIMTGAKGTLIDSVGKKVFAVNEFAGCLGLSNVRALHIRAEDLAREDEHYNAVFARAVAQSNVLVEYASPLLSHGGYCVLEKANISDDELVAARRAAHICALSLVSRETFELPRGLGHREILVFEKTGRPKVKLPRRTGEAKMKPLGI